MPKLRLYPRRCLRLLRRLLILPAALLLLTVAPDSDDATALLASYRLGAENSWIRVQNVGQANAVLELSYFDEQGRLAGKDACPSPVCPQMFPGSGWTFFQRDNPGLPRGFQGSAVVSTDQPIVALQAKDFLRNGSFSIAGDAVPARASSSRLYLPLTAKRDGPNGSWSGRFAVQNLSETVTACLTLTYLSIAADDEVAWEPYRPAANVPRRLAGCPHGGMPLPPRGTLFRDPDTMIVANGFTGSVRIDLHRNGQDQGPEKQLITATADSWNRDIASFASYRGFAESDLGTEIVLPLIDREVGPANSYSTRFQISNRDPARPAAVQLSFQGWDLGASPPVFIEKRHAFSVKGARFCFQDRDDSHNCLAAGDRLPFNFVGTARITASEPVAVIVDRGTSINQGFTNYRGVRPQDGGRRVLLPVLNKNFGPAPGASGWNSWFRVMVADGGRANVTVRYFGLDLPGGSVAYSVAADREFTVFQYLESLLPDGFAGTAIIEADRPIVALADLFTDVFKGDPDFVYNGIALE